MDAKIINKRDKIYAKFVDQSIESLKAVIGNIGSKDTFLWHVNNLETDNNLKDRTKKEYWQYYFTKIFPVSLKMFKAMAAYQVSSGEFNNELYLPRIYPNFMEDANKYDILISLVGFSPEPVMHTICTLQPKEKIYLICSRETKEFPNTSVSFIDFVEVLLKENKLQLSKSEEPVELNEIGFKNPEISVEAMTVDSVHSDEIIQVIKRIAEKEKDKNKKKIAIDITGGKKTMLAGAFTIASVFSIPGYYVDFEKYNTSNSRPIYGTEFLNKVRNPLVGYILKKYKIVFDRLFLFGGIIPEEEYRKMSKPDQEIIDSEFGPPDFDRVR